MVCAPDAVDGLDARVEHATEDGGKEEAVLRGVLFGDEGWGEGKGESDSVNAA